MKVNFNLILATFALALGSFMNILDLTIVNTAISHIAGDFAIPANDGTWIITSYAVSEAIMLPVTGWLTSRFGAVRQYIFGTAMFTVASILCGLSVNFQMIITMRALQGLVGASMIPLAQSLLAQIYPPEKRNVAMGFWAMTAVLAPIAGPITGGWITDNLTWRWAFYINIPFGIFSCYAVYYVFKKMNHKDIIKKVPVDYVGFILLAIGVGALQILLDKGNDLDWFSSSLICVLATIAFIFLVVFYFWEDYHPHPIVNLSFLKNKNFMVGVWVLCIGVSAYFATVVVLPLWLQNFMGYTAFESGLTTATTGIFIVLLSPIIGSNIHKVDARKVVVFGFFVFFAISYLTAKLTPDVTSEYLMFTRMFLGLGLVCFFIPLTTITFSEISPQDTASASGLSNFMRNIGNSFGTSLVVVYWEHRQSFHHEQLISNINTGNPNYHDFINTLAGITIQQQPVLINNLIDSQAALMGVNDVILVSGLMMLALIPLVFIASRPKKFNLSTGH